MARYAWIITTDHLAEPGAEPGSFSENAATVAGPSDATPEEIELAETGGHLFRLKDDDGEVYYTGRIWFEQDSGAPQARLLGAGFKPGIYCVYAGLDMADEQAVFGPLNDFGTGNAGCTTIEYKCAVTDEDGDTVKVWAML